jgi:microcin C transport system permease protein
MFAYILRRLLLMIPTLFGIMLVSFVIIQFAPGGPIERILQQVNETGGGETFGGGGDGGTYRGAQGIDPRFIEELERQFGFDKPPAERFFLMLWNYLRFDFGQSFQHSRPVIDLIVERLPVSISLGLWVTLIAYMVSIPLGVRKAVKDGTPFDFWTSFVVIVGYAIPGFLLAILLKTVFSKGSSMFPFFPLRGLTSARHEELPGFLQAMYPQSEVGLTAAPADFLPWYWQTVDYLWHITLPTAAIVVGVFATLTLLTKNSFLDEIRKQYVLTARMKGLTENRVLYGHVFRNAMLIVIAGFPGAFIAAFFTGSLLIEMIFSLEGLGLLSFDSVMKRDYPVVFANLYIFALLGLVIRLISDLTYTWVDPRIDFETRNA